MTHNPAAAHPRLLALLDGMEKIEQDATSGLLQAESGTFGRYRTFVEDSTGHLIMVANFENSLNPAADCKLHALSRNALPTLLAFLRRRAEEAAADWQRTMTAVQDWQRMTAGEEYDPEAQRDIDRAATAHHACCTTALAAAAGTPALALLAGELQNMMEAQDG